MSESEVDALRLWCQERGYWIGPGDRVTEVVAAAAFGRSPKTLRNWRAESVGPPFTRIRGRVFYTLHDLARFIPGPS